MKKILLPLALMFTAALNAQIANNSFEVWQNDTIYFPGISQVPPDTFEVQNPANWTSSNSLTGADSLGGVAFVTQSNVAYHGSSSVQLITDTIGLPTIPNFPLLNLIFPGFVVNGKFPINTETLLTSGDVISPMAILGAGQPFTAKLSKIKGFYNYVPKVHSITNLPDTCIVWAALKKWNPATGMSDLIGEAIFKSTAATAGYAPFEADFTYVSCDDPDTLVVFIASSVPNVAAIIGGGASGLQAGSVLLVDSVYYESLPGGYNFVPIAIDDIDTTTKNVPITLAVKTNDDDCDDAIAGVTIAIATQAGNGNAAVSGSNIVYTPANNFVGVDEFTYTLNDGSATSSPAKVRMLVLPSVGINDVAQVAMKLYPVPVTDVLNIQIENNTSAEARIFDAMGRLVKTAMLNDTNNAVSVQGFANGVYAVQILNADDRIIARSTFTVAK
jgi:hypothetical protein